MNIASGENRIGYWGNLHFVGKSAHVGKSALCGETCDFCGEKKINHFNSPLLSDDVFFGASSSDSVAAEASPSSSLDMQGLYKCTNHLE